MKLLFVSEYWEPHGQGGGEISAAMLARALARGGVDIHVLTSAFPGSPAYERKEDVVIHRKLQTAKSPHGILNNITRTINFPRSVRKEVKHLLEHERFDVIHYFNATSASGAPKTEVPRAVHVNSPVFFCPKGTLMYQDRQECHYKCTPVRFLRCFVKSHEFGKTRNAWYHKWNPIIWLALYVAWRKRVRALKEFDCSTPNSAFMDHKLHDIGIPNERINVVPNVVVMPSRNANRETPAAKTTKGVIRILYAGTFIESKGVLQLIDAMKGITIPYDLHIYGQGPLKDEIKRRTSLHQLNATIHDPVPHDQLLNLLPSFDVVIQPSHVAEAMPRTVLEALGAGCAVISSDVGGAKTILANGVNGVLYDPTKPGALTESIKRVLTDAKLRETVRKNAAKSVAQYSEKEVAANLVKLYRELITRKQAANAQQSSMPR